MNPGLKVLPSEVDTPWLTRSSDYALPASSLTPAQARLTAGRARPSSGRDCISWTTSRLSATLSHVLPPNRPAGLVALKVLSNRM